MRWDLWHRLESSLVLGCVGNLVMFRIIFFMVRLCEFPCIYVFLNPMSSQGSIAFSLPLKEL